jgi:hypothetical protein
MKSFQRRVKKIFQCVLNNNNNNEKRIQSDSSKKVIVDFVKSKLM